MNPQTDAMELTPVFSQHSTTFDCLQGPGSCVIHPPNAVPNRRLVCAL